MWKGSCPPRPIKAHRGEWISRYKEMVPIGGLKKMISDTGEVNSAYGGFEIPTLVIATFLIYLQFYW
jgi:hypothetical protein